MKAKTNHKRMATTCLEGAHSDYDELLGNIPPDPNGETGTDGPRRITNNDTYYR